MKIAAVCCTYLRPRQLEEMVACFLRQDYADRQLVILDDAGQYADQRGDRWRLVSVERRFATLGQKRNAAARLVDDDALALAVWDDDDLYLPWALRAAAAALGRADWSRPSLVLVGGADGKVSVRPTGGRFHGGWAYRREAFERLGGYPPVDRGEDRALAERLRRGGATECDPCRLGFPPSYVFRRGGSGAWHLSAMPADGYRRLGLLRATGPRLVLRAADRVGSAARRPDAKRNRAFLAR